MHTVLMVLIILVCIRVSRQAETGDITVFRTDLDRDAARLFLNDHQKLSSSLKLGDYVVFRSQINQKNRFEKLSNLSGQQFDEIAYNPNPNVGIKRYLHKRVLECTVKASAVDSYSKEWGFIASAVPNNAEEVQSFWDMVWNKHVFVIVMLAGPGEFEVMKQTQYWRFVRYHETWTGTGRNELEVRKLDVIASTDKFTCTHMTITCTNYYSQVTRGMAHCLYYDWPDMGAAGDVKALLNFRRTLKSLNRFGPEDFDFSLRPIVIQSRQGQGRPGTMIAIDVLIDRTNMEHGLVDLAGTIQRLRSQCFFGVKTREQYSFCIEALVAYRELS